MKAKTQRVLIWVIAIVMTVGTLGAYFLVILDSGNTKREQESAITQSTTKQQAADPTAYKVEGKVAELKIDDLKVGDGAVVQANDTVRVHYKGTIAQTGVKFDSSYDRGEPITFALSGVIQGWQEGMLGMKVGGKRRLIIPSAKAYGDQDNSGIPANSDLVFEIELLAINPAT